MVNFSLPGIFFLYQLFSQISNAKSLSLYSLLHPYHTLVCKVQVRTILFLFKALPICIEIKETAILGLLAGHWYFWTCPGAMDASAVNNLLWK